VKKNSLKVVIKPKNTEKGRKDIQSMLREKLKPDDVDFVYMKMAKYKRLIYSCNNAQDQKGQ
jgi:hypothetical protein